MITRFDPERLHRRSIRLSGFDYSRSGAYFVTVCTHDRLCFFGEILSGEMHLNEDGQRVAWAWEDLPKHYPHLDLDAFVIMPNHLHGVLLLACNPTEARRHAVPEVVRAFKTYSSRRINRRYGIAGQPIWQRNYFERVLRSEEELEKVRRYIAENPARWQWDQENPEVNKVPRPEKPPG